VKSALPAEKDSKTAKVKDNDPIARYRGKPNSRKLENNMETQHLEKRFGVLAVEKGIITADQVIEAFRIQVMEDIEKGKHRLIGRILLEQGLITLSQIDDVLKSMEKNLPLLKEE
jgi:hypothetical protein